MKHNMNQNNYHNNNNKINKVLEFTTFFNKNIYDNNKDKYTFVDNSSKININNIGGNFNHFRQFSNNNLNFL